MNGRALGFYNLGKALAWIKFREACLDGVCTLRKRVACAQAPDRFAQSGQVRLACANEFAGASRGNTLHRHDLIEVGTDTQHGATL